MKRFFLFALAAIVFAACSTATLEMPIPSNEIWYTSSDGNVIKPYSGYLNSNATAMQTFGANITSNTYENGVGVITFDGDVTTIGKSAFAHCEALTSVTIPDSVTTIGDWAFDSCEALTSVTIPDSVTTIGKYAFSQCASLTSVTIPDSVTTIGSGAFSSCNALKTFYGKFASADNRCLIVNGVLKSFAPAGLTTYSIPDSVTTIGDYAFASCSALKSVTIPDSVTTIGYHAFAFCDALTSVTIPDSVTVIGEGAFRYCSALTSVTIPDSVTTIGYHAFANCYALTSVTIPDSVTTIGDRVFGYCSALKEVYCKPTTPPSLGSSFVFDFNASDRKIYVPTASVDAYKSKQYWSEYADAIEPYNFTE